MKKILASVIIVLVLINLIYSQNWKGKSQGWHNKTNYVEYVDGENTFSTNEIGMVFCGNEGAFSNEFAYVNVHYYNADGVECKSHGLGLSVSENGTKGIIEKDLKMCDRVREWLNVEGQTIEFSNENFCVRLRGKMPFIGEKK